MSEQELLRKIFLEDFTMSTEDPMHFYVTDKDWNEHLDDMIYLKGKGYKFSMSMVMDKEGTKFSNLR